ncbi:MAG: methyltransferase domain-containing protein [Acidimicrobiales bacterium]
MPADNTTGWDRWAEAYQAGARLPTDVAVYGPDIATERDLRLLGDLRGKRVVELGCGGAQSAIAFAKQGAIAIGVDASTEQLAHAKALSVAEGVRVELRHGDLADLAFLRADSVDLVFSAYALGYVEDVGRVFRQVHRVLRVGAPLVFSLEHPASYMVDGHSSDPLSLTRSYFDPSTVDWQAGGDIDFTSYPHTIADLVTALVRASYRVDAILEPPPTPDGPRSQHWNEAMRYVPATLIMRARKEGN